MSIRRKWLKIVMLLFLSGVSLIGPLNPQEIEEQMRIMNRNETIITTDADPNGDDAFSKESPL